MPLLVILVDKDGHNPDGILGTGITWQMLIILAQVDGHNPDGHSDDILGMVGCKVNLKVLVILSVMTVLTCHGSNDDSSDKKF